MAKKFSVGLTVILEAPWKKGICAILQRRGEFSGDKLTAHSFPGTFQLTLFEKGEGEEQPLQTLLRGINEELGSSTIVPWEHIQEVWTRDTPEKFFVFYAVFVSDAAAFFRNVRLNASTGGFRAVLEAELQNIQLVDESQKVAGVSDFGATFMRADEKEAVKKSFEAYAEGLLLC